MEHCSVFKLHTPTGEETTLLNDGFGTSRPVRFEWWPFEDELLPAGLRYFASNTLHDPVHYRGVLVYEEPPRRHYVQVSPSIMSKVGDSMTRTFSIPLPWLYYIIPLTNLSLSGMRGPNSNLPMFHKIKLMMRSTQLCRLEDEVIVPPLFNVYVDSQQTIRELQDGTNCTDTGTLTGKICIPHLDTDCLSSMSFGQMLSIIMDLAWAESNYDIIEAVKLYISHGPLAIYERMGELYPEKKKELSSRGESGWPDPIDYLEALETFSVEEICAYTMDDWLPRECSAIPLSALIPQYNRDDNHDAHTLVVRQLQTYT